MTLELRNKNEFKLIKNSIGETVLGGFKMKN